MARKTGFRILATSHFAKTAMRAAIAREELREAALAAMMKNGDIEEITDGNEK